MTELWQGWLLVALLVWFVPVTVSYLYRGAER